MKREVSVLANLRLHALVFTIMLAVTDPMAHASSDAPPPRLENDRDSSSASVHTDARDRALLGLDVKGTWVKRYASQGKGNDSARAIAVDPDGNILVTGTSSGNKGSDQDVVTIKYEAGNGKVLWAKRYKGSGGSMEYASALNVDTAGNVHVTGTSQGGSTQSDYVTIKYDPSGNDLWIKRYNGSDSSDDTANAMAIDAQGNVYVTGSSWRHAAREDYATIKYDPNGIQRWERLYGEAFSDAAVAVVVDPVGNIYVTGQSMGSGTDYDYATVKYDSSGNQLWVRRYNGPANGYDAPSGLVADNEGNIYVTGQSLGVGTSYDYATVKYDTAGNELWAQRFDGPDNGDDFAHALTVDEDGNVFVTGASLSSTRLFDFCTVNYDASGNQIWVRNYDMRGQEDIAHAIAVDTHGGVYITGESVGSSPNPDYALVKYDTSGNQLWVVRHDAGNADVGTALAVDILGQIYVTGTARGSHTGDDFLTIRYDQ